MDCGPRGLSGLRSAFALLAQGVGSAGQAPPAARAYPARVVAVTDGDTIRVLTVDQREVRVRLAEVDAPESGQPYGRTSKRELSTLVFGRTVVVAPTDVDRYGRTVARVRVGGVDASTEMVRRGAAWVFVAYSHDRSLPPLEARARAARAGLWGLPAVQRVAPWEWRRGRREDAHAILPSFPSVRLPFVGGQPGPPAGLSCSAKRFCSQMTSCEEAVYHFRTCRQRRLDGDGDGKPCERLCG